MADDLAHLAIDVGVVEHVDADLVVVPGVVRQILVVPDELAGIDIERHDGVRVEIVARSRLRIVDRDRISGAPDGEPVGRIVGAGLPQPAAAGLPCVGLVLPGLAAGLAGLWDDVPAPQLVAGPRVETGEPAAGAGIAGAVRHDDLAVGRDRRRAEALLVAEFVGLGNLLVPHHFAAVAIDADHAAVVQIGDYEVFPQRDAARLRNVALVLDAGIGNPHELAVVAAAHVDLVDCAPAVARIHEAVVD